MGKTVKSRAIMSIASLLLVAVFCIVANGSVPKLYESYKLKEVAKQAATQTTHVIKKDKPVKQEEPTVPAEEPVTEDQDDANVYDVPEEPEEEPVEEEEEEEDFDFDFDIDDDNGGSKSEGGSLLDKIIGFFTSLFEKISSCKLLTKIKDFLAKFLKIFGVTL